MKRIVVFTGAGVSAESGLKTFRDSGGLWEEYDIEEVATPEAWERNQELVLEFYNMRRRQVVSARPNEAHEAIAALESLYNVDVITQNIDNLHERAGSTRVLHLHGEIMKSQSSRKSSLVYDVKGDIALGDLCELGSQLRPHVVWFGESVPMIPKACELMTEADIVLIVGTSLNVYPAAGIVHYASPGAEIFLVDPASVETASSNRIEVITGTAVVEVPKLVDLLLTRALVD